MVCPKLNLEDWFMIYFPFGRDEDIWHPYKRIALLVSPGLNRPGFFLICSPNGKGT